MIIVGKYPPGELQETYPNQTGKSSEKSCSKGPWEGICNRFQVLGTVVHVSGRPGDWHSGKGDSSQKYRDVYHGSFMGCHRTQLF